MKKFKLNYLPMTLMLISCFSISEADTTLSTNNGFSNVSNNGLSIAKVRFFKSLKLDGLVSLLSDTNANIAIIESQYDIGSKVLTEFYSLPSNTSVYDINVNELKEEYRQHRKSMLNAVLKNSVKLNNKVNSNTSMFKSMNDILTNNTVTDILISGITLTGDNEELSRVIQKGNIQSLEVSTVENIRKNIKVPTTKNKSSRSIPSWLPVSGYSFVNEDSGYRYSLQYMWWNTNNFDSDDTYEHDFFLNNYDNNLGTYLNPNSTSYPDCFPVTTYASTTWPTSSYPYLDTRLAQNLIECEYKETPYTIGAAKADAIPVGDWEYTYIETLPGNVNVDKFKLQAQKGYRFPSSCYTTWCSFGDEIVNLIPAWNSTVPGDVAW